MITMKTALLPYQEQAVEKLRGLKVGALYMAQGTGNRHKPGGADGKRHGGYHHCAEICRFL